jgi:hypothetical protein
MKMNRLTTEEKELQAEPQEAQPPETEQKETHQEGLIMTNMTGTQGTKAIIMTRIDRATGGKTSDFLGVPIELQIGIMVMATMLQGRQPELQKETRE